MDGSPCRRRPSPLPSYHGVPNHVAVVAYLPLFLVLTGGSAVALTGRNTVFSDDITNNEVRSADVRNDNLSGGGLTSQDVRPDALTGNHVANLTGGDVADNTLTGADVNESTLGQVPSAQGATDADRLDGLDSPRVHESPRW